MTLTLIRRRRAGGADYFSIRNRTVLVLLRHDFLRVRDAATAPQQGHRMIVLLRARLSRTRMVAIEFGTWRSGRKGRSSGSIIVG
jgi:hypothetical protein